MGFYVFDYALCNKNEKYIPNYYYSFLSQFSKKETMCWKLKIPVVDGESLCMVILMIIFKTLLPIFLLNNSMS